MPPNAPYDHNDDASADQPAPMPANGNGGDSGNRRSADSDSGDRREQRQERRGEREYGTSPRAPEGWVDRRSADRGDGRQSEDRRSSGRDRRSSAPQHSGERDSQSPGLRLQKALARAGVASRRDCEQLIEEGRVTVNGERPTQHPVFIDPEADRVEVDGVVVRINGRARNNDERGTNRGIGARRTYIMLNKPKRVVSTVEDEDEFRGQRKTVIDIIDPALRGSARLFPVGRLDADSTGLLLLTDDGDLAHRLTHPSFEVTKRYEVTVKGRIEEKDLDKLREGLLLTTGKPGEGDRDDKPDVAVKRAKAQKVMILGRHTDRDRGDLTVLGITLAEGQNREIRRLLARVGFVVKRLKRNAIGPLELKGLATGEARVLTRGEVTSLRRITGMKL